VITRRALLASTPVAALAASSAGIARAQAGAIRIGDINSYSGLPAFTLPYRKGWQLAVDEINARGGVAGRRLEVISLDDAGRPGDAVTAANGLVANERCVLLAGTYFSNVGLAVADFAKQRKVPFVAAEPLTDALVWSQGNRYTFRLRPSTYMQSAMLVEEAAKQPAKRWATVAPNYEYGQAAVAAFKRLLSEKRPDVQWVAEQWPAQGKIDAGATLQALERARPEALFNVTFATDLARLVREGHTVGFFKGKTVASLLTGEPEYLEPLGAEAPDGWIVTGYPYYDITTPEHQRFVTAYRERFNEAPRCGSLVGYNTFRAIGAALEKARSTEAEALVRALKGLTFESPIGPITFRAADHQSTMGAWVGRTAKRDGKGVMVDWRYADGAEYLPDDKAVAALRPAE
jgi:branched-chain amino acid transport system substrate-binding protein